MHQYPLLQTKLHIPPIRPELVPRQRLIDRLNAGLRSGHKLTLVSAPAGFGKTTLVAHWLRQTERPAAWLSLDKGDNDPIRFFTYLLTALQKVDPDIGKTALTMLQAPQPPAPEPLLTTLINDIAETPRPFIFVLDDYHNIDAQSIHDALASLLDHLPPQMHLVIATRADPPLPIPRLRGRGQLAELYQSDLRFTRKEMAQFLDLVLGQRLSAEDMIALERRTEGWIAGLQMAAISMRGRDDISGFVRAFTGSHRYILDYLGEEVLRQQSRDVQMFLLQTAILDRLSGALCDAVMGATESAEVDSQSVLEYLEKHNLFVAPLDDERKWYRYHHLFTDLLRQRLQREKPDLVPELHLRASQWYEKNELVSEAVNHAMVAGDVERVAGLVEENSLAMMDRGESATLLKWLNALPHAVTRSHPWLCVARAWVLVYAGQLDAVESPLQVAENVLDSLEECAQKRRIAGHAAAIRMYATLLKGNMGLAVEFGRKALKHLPETDLVARGFAASHVAAALRMRGDLAAATQASAEVISVSKLAGEKPVTAEALCILAGTQILEGRLQEAAASCREAIRLADEYLRQRGRCLPVTGLAYSRLSQILLEWNDIDEAMASAREGTRLLEQWGQADVLLIGYREMAHALQASGDADGALDAIERGLRLASGMSQWVHSDMAADQAKLWLAQGNLQAASRWAAQCGLTAANEHSLHRKKEYLVFAQVLIAQGKEDQALKLLAQLVNKLQAVGVHHSLIAARVLQATAFQTQVDSAQALGALERALSLAEPEGYVRTFVDQGEPMTQLLRRALAEGIAPSYVSKLLAAFGGRALSAPPAMQALVDQPLVDPLTERELEVLRLIAAGLSNREIAQELFVAVSTVKTHINHIYGKLDAKSRIQAVAKAQALDLV